MNFLTIAQTVRSEAGLSGNGPSSVLSQSGMDLKVVNWVNDAYYDIQSAKKDWRWMWRSDGLIATVVGQRAYDISAFSVQTIDIDSIRMINTGDATSVVPLEFVEYPEFRELTVFTAQRNNAPQIVTIDPSGQFLIDPVPIADQTIYFEYFIEPSYLVENSDIPSIPEKFHRVIIERALMKYAAHDDAVTTYQDAQANYKMWMRRMQAEQTLDMTVADPLV